MIIDLILDRKDGKPYSPNKFYDEVSEYGTIGDDIAGALNYGTNENVQNVLCSYIKENNYAPSICKYIKSVNWL